MVQMTEHYSQLTFYISVSQSPVTSLQSTTQSRTPLSTPTGMSGSVQSTTLSRTPPSTPTGMPGSVQSTSCQRQSPGIHL